MIPPSSQLQIDIYGSEKSSTLLDFSRLLYHLDLSYEIGRLATDSKYAEFPFPQHTFRRVVSPLEYSDQLRLNGLRHESPWQLSVSLQDVFTALGGGLGAFWLFIQCLDKLSMYRLNRTKVKAEIAKALLEVERHKRELAALGVPSPNRVPDSKTLRDRIDGPTRLEKTATRLLESRDDNEVLVPPNESVKLYNRLGSRGAYEFYESNSRVLLKLGYEVRDMDVRINERSHE